MRVISLGKITSTPGTPVRLTTDTTIRTECIFFQQAPGGTAASYCGVAGNGPDGNPNPRDFPMNKTTFVGIIHAFPPVGATGQAEHRKLCAEDNLLQLADFYVDMDTGSAGLIVSYVQG